MAKKQMTIVVRGTQSRWGFTVVADPQYLDEWRADGLEINVLENSVPQWVAALGLARAWCFAQDLLNFRNPWSRP